MKYKLDQVLERERNRREQRKGQGKEYQQEED
jgi:hypothetical protein